MPERGLSLATDEALVLVALPGVQQFITEARSTSDVAGASKIYVALGSLIARTLHDLGGRLVFPSSLDETSGITNKVVALFAADGSSGLVNQAEIADALRAAVEANGVRAGPAGHDHGELPGCAPKSPHDHGNCPSMPGF